MRLAYVVVGNGAPELALWEDPEVVLVGRVWPADAPVPSEPMALIAGGPAALEAAARAVRAAAGRRDLRRPADAVTVLAPVPHPPRIFALARNYRAHAIERGGLAEREGTLPQVFLKPGASTLNHHLGEIELGPESVFPDYEAELAVVIGRGGRAIPEACALEHVFGYTAANDVTERRLHGGRAGRKAAERDEFFDWLNGKWLDGSCPIGPCLVTADEIPDPAALRITCHINQELRQDERAGNMIHKIPAILAFLSGYLALRAGDVILTGTPVGVGKPLGKPLRDGDVITTEISGIGRLVNPVRARP
ncbi:MAG: fumarylacetoacetate hydrolase family protein [Planctomycetes bacterium]|nr:fumarylacetoacetate hydrolase family protein [Planctomycetota bacterium]